MDPKTNLPAAVRASRWSTLSFFVFGALLPGVPLSLTLAPPVEGSRIVTGVIALIGAVLWIVGSLDSLTRVTRLTREGLESRSLFGTQGLKHGDIAGYRRDNDGNVKIAHVNKAGHDVDLPTAVLKHPEWQAWLATLTDLDAKDLSHEAAELERDDRLGDSIDERRRTILRLRRWTSLLTGAGFAIALWVLFYPEPYRVAGIVCLVAPLIAILLTARWQPAVSLIYDSDVWVGGSLVGLWTMPCIAMAMFAVRETLIDWQIVMLVALGPAVLLLIVSILADQRLANVFGVIFGGAIAYGWACGALVFANVYLDEAESRIVLATVVERNGEAKDEPALTLASPTLPNVLDSIDVSERRWLAAPPGSTVCLKVYPGRFGWRYAYVTDCPVPPLVRGS